MSDNDNFLPPNGLEIISEYLNKNGYDGLVDLDNECGCGLDDLAPCACEPSKCRPAYKKGDLFVIEKPIDPKPESKCSKCGGYGQYSSVNCDKCGGSGKAPPSERDEVDFILTCLYTEGIEAEVVGLGSDRVKMGREIKQAREELARELDKLKLIGGRNVSENHIASFNDGIETAKHLIRGDKKEIK